MKRRNLIAMLIAEDELVPRVMLDAVIENCNHSLMDSARHNRDIIAQFLVELDRPEDHDELRETLHQALVDLSDHVARLEEHVS